MSHELYSERLSFFLLWYSKVRSGAARCVVSFTQSMKRMCAVLLLLVRVQRSWYGVCLSFALHLFVWVFVHCVRMQLCWLYSPYRCTWHDVFVCCVLCVCMHICVSMCVCRCMQVALNSSMFVYERLLDRMVWGLVAKRACLDYVRADRSDAVAKCVCVCVCVQTCSVFNGCCHT